MRVLWAGLILVLASTGAAPAGQDGPAEAADETLDLQGCSACTLRHQNMTKRHRELQAAKEARGDCQIKGDIGEDGERLYHLPGESRYGWVWISEAKGERWFCSAEEAEAAGWRAVQ